MIHLERSRVGLSLLGSACLAGLLALTTVGPVAAAPPKPSAVPSHSRGAVSGVVSDQVDGRPIENALVVLQCTCLAEPREAMTNARGVYAFTDLPPGTYTVQALAGEANVSKLLELARGSKLRANFSLELERNQMIEIVVEASPVATSAASAMTISMDQAKQLPVGRHSSRDFTAVVDLAPTASADSTGRTRERYKPIREHEFNATHKSAISTFAIDVDTASYSNVRRFLADKQRPPSDAVRIEELINYFSYDYAPPSAAGQPFSVTTEVADCPWNPKARLLHIGLQGRAIPAAQLPARNLVFLLDVSGSMDSPDKLPLLRRAMQMLVATLGPADTVAIVVYAGASGVVLPPTSGADQATIMAALERLEAGGSTNGGAGIELAYALARERFDAQAINRVILATDGDFNVGNVSPEGLQALIEAEREGGVFLSVLGFGTGNLQDATMEMLADKGNGNYAYIDGLGEARKVLVEEAGSTLVTIAKDVKIQVEFDPTQVESYRLIGYENRALQTRDFDDDRKDAGEIGSGHSVTALYEFVPTKPAKCSKKSKRQKRRNKPNRCDKPSNKSSNKPVTLGELRLRHKPPQGDASELQTVKLVDRRSSLAHSSDDFRFAAAVAEFGMLLRRSKGRGTSSFAEVVQLATGALGQDRGGHRRAFLDLVAQAQGL